MPETISECLFIGGPMHGRSLVPDGNLDQAIPKIFDLRLTPSPVGSDEHVATYHLYAEHDLEDELFAIYVADGTRKQRIYDYICEHDVLGSPPHNNLDVYV